MPQPQPAPPAHGGVPDLGAPIPTTDALIAAHHTLCATASTPTHPTFLPARRSPLSPFTLFGITPCTHCQNSTCSAPCTQASHTCHGVHIVAMPWAVRRGFIDRSWPFMNAFRKDWPGKQWHGCASKNTTAISLTLINTYHVLHYDLTPHIYITYFLTQNFGSEKKKNC